VVVEARLVGLLPRARCPSGTDVLRKLMCRWMTLTLERQRQTSPLRGGWLPIERFRRV
jgi:hypothetical protein